MLLPDTLQLTALSRSTSLSLHRKHRLACPPACKHCLCPPIQTKPLGPIPRLPGTKTKKTHRCRGFPQSGNDSQSLVSMQHADSTCPANNWQTQLRNSILAARIHRIYLTKTSCWLPVGPFVALREERGKCITSEGRGTIALASQPFRQQTWQSKDHSAFACTCAVCMRVCVVCLASGQPTTASETRGHGV